MVDDGGLMPAIQLLITRKSEAIYGKIGAGLLAAGSNLSCMPVKHPYALGLLEQ